ncbi:MAG: cobalt ECF transporter T component CbiQ [archaeon]|nr:cobalt ECF transporter T component CbiQ [archaeon]
MSEQLEMDELAYSSRMLDWAPLGKLLLVMALLIVGLCTDSIVVPLITFTIGIILMAYSTNMRIPTILALGIAEAIVIMVIGSGMISIMGNESEPALWDGQLLWFKVHMTVTSFNKAWLIFFRAVAGVTLMLSFASSTPIPHLAQSLRSLRCPKELVELIVLIYRYAFLLLERFLVMLDAAQCRLGYNGPMTAIKSYGGAMAGTFIFSMELAEKSEASLACRNYQGYLPIYRLPRSMSWKWVVFTFALAAVLLYIGWETVGLIDMEHIFAPYFGW